MFRILAVLVFLLLGVGAQAATHRATHLGNPATRFAAPLKTPEDLRRTLTSPALQDDVLKILRMSEYNGSIEDFRHAATTAPIQALRIPVGTLLPAMSTRVKGKPDLLRQVLWAGKEPIAAYEFSFVSGEHRYRVIAPKACSNFWVEEQFPRPQPALALSCEAPATSAKSDLITWCNTLGNSGDLPEALAMLSLPMPVGAKVKCVSGGANTTDSTQLSWKFNDLAPGAKRTVCATFAPFGAGPVEFRSAAVGNRAAGVTSSCTTAVSETASALLEVTPPTPGVAGELTYGIKVLNQNTRPLTHLKIVANLEEDQHFVGGSGSTPVLAGEDGRIRSGEIALLNPQEGAEWQITVKANSPHFQVDLEADQFFCPIQKSVATTRN